MLSFSLTKGTGEGGNGTAGCSAVEGDLGSPTYIIGSVPVFPRSVPCILRLVSQHTICFCILFLCSIFLALAMMGQTLHKTLWCLMHLLLFLLSLMSECFGIIKCTVSINGSFFLSTGLGGEGRGMLLQLPHQILAVGQCHHLHIGYKKKAVPRRGVIGNPGRAPMLYSLGLLSCQYFPKDNKLVRIPLQEFVALLPSRV